MPVPPRPRRFFLDFLSPPKATRPRVPPLDPPASAPAPASPAVEPVVGAKLVVAADPAAESPPTSSPESCDVDGRLATDESVSARGPTDTRPLNEPSSEVSELVTEPAIV